MIRSTGSIMASQKTKEYRPIEFVTARNSTHDDSSTAKKRRVKEYETKSKIDGVEARSFYEELVSETGKHESKSAILKPTSRSHKKQKPSKKQKHLRNSEKELPKKTITDRDRDNYLKSAQNDDLKQVKWYLQQNGDIDYRDKFGWNALMCAAHNGAMSVVRHLLECKIDLRAKDALGRTADIIAQLGDHQEIVELIKEHMDFPDAIHSKPFNFNVKVKLEKIFCETCNQMYTGDPKAHETSTVHLFNCQHQSSSTLYHLPESNRGFQLMVKSGWDVNKGLGSKNQGQKFPVKTVLKRDRQGLGSSAKPKAKITHFGPRDKKAVEHANKNPLREMRIKTLSKKQMKREQEKKKTWERDMRRYMNME